MFEFYHKIVFLLNTKGKHVYVERFITNITVKLFSDFSISLFTPGPFGNFHAGRICTPEVPSRCGHRLSDRHC